MKIVEDIFANICSALANGGYKIVAHLLPNMGVTLTGIEFQNYCIGK